MAQLFGKKLTKRELFDRIGNLSQIAGVKKYVLSEGKESGIEAIEVRTGGGLEYTILPGRALDIAWAQFNGVPVSFISKSGITDPSYFCALRKPWGSSFYGGLLTTCGLTSVGLSSEYNGRTMATHGDISNIPAAKVGAFEDWHGDEMTMGARGTVRQAQMYREELELTREISSNLGENAIYIKDRVENLGAERQPLMVLYHINFGYPMVSGDTEAKINSAKTTAAPGADEKGPELFEKYFEPGEGEHPDRCVHHDIIPDGDGKSRASLINTKLGIEATVEFDKKEMKAFCHWTRLMKGDYVTALEPCNNFGLGTAGEEAAGTLEYIEPGEVREFNVKIAFKKI